METEKKSLRELMAIGIEKNRRISQLQSELSDISLLEKKMKEADDSRTSIEEIQIKSKKGFRQLSKPSEKFGKHLYQMMFSEVSKRIETITGKIEEFKNEMDAPVIEIKNHGGNG